MENESKNVVFDVIPQSDITLTLASAEEPIDKSLLRYYSKDVSVLIGYLLGVKEEFLEKINDDTPTEETIRQFEKNESAVIIRHLNNLRSNIMLGFKSISRNIRIQSPDYKPIYMQQYLEDDFKALGKLGVNFITTRTDLDEYLSIINKEISLRIHDTEPLFPDWLDFRHIVFMFNMPSNIEPERRKYQANQNCYPFKRYFYWKNPVIEGNILNNDLKLLNIIYRNNDDYFESSNKVSDASGTVKKNINDFIQNGSKVQIFVDGENVDPYRFADAIDGLKDHEIQKINKIVVYYDELYSVSAWQYLKHFSHDIEVETIAVERIKENKSLVDHKLVVGVSKAVYSENVDSVILASSDSDFWAVIEDVDADYLVMVESDKCGSDFKNILRKNGIFYCYLDRFISPADDIYFKSVFKKELSDVINSSFIMPFAREIFDAAYIQTRADISEAEKEKIYKSYIEKLKLKIDGDGKFTIEIPE